MILLQPGIALQKLLVQKCDGTASAAGIALQKFLVQKVRSPSGDRIFYPSEKDFLSNGIIFMNTS